jgi:predicted TPR repeat methyltransferase
MSRLDLTSGDLLADRRADYARMMLEGGDAAGAADLMQQALELAPLWAAGWFQLSEIAEKLQNTELAIQACQKVLELAPDDVFGAGLKLALLQKADAPARPPSRYVEQLFDDYADRFETALVEKLAYIVPQRLAAFVRRAAPSFYRTAVDIGCGTGLLAPQIRDLCGVLEGCDLSVNMLAKAREKAIYDHLFQSDLSLAPDQSGLFGEGPGKGFHRADLVAAADVLMYLGSLEEAFVNVQHLLAPKGVFAFSVEDAETKDGFHLAPSLRYAHSQQHIENLCAANRFEIHAMERLVIRMDAGKPVNGILFLTQNSA